jgi:hypothetical protein
VGFIRRDCLDAAAHSSDTPLDSSLTSFTPRNRHEGFIQNT